MANKDDYVTTYREFFEYFAQTVNPNDQLPVKLASYKLLNIEVVGGIIDWTTQYLTQKKCPPDLFSPLIKIIIEEIRKSCKKHPLNCGFNSTDNAYEPLKLMQAVMAKTNEVCLRYLDNSMLCSLPAPSNSYYETSIYAIRNKRRTMEDRHVVLHDLNTMFNIQEAIPSSYYAIFDGHAGHDAAAYSSAHLHQYLAENKNFIADPEQALYDAFCKTDALFLEKCKVENLIGGTTAVVALLRPKERMLYIAWVGDSQALLVKQGQILQCVNPHKPCREDERERIEKAGGCVMLWGIWRVNGQLAVSRAIGDADYKPHVIAIPDVREISLDGCEDFLIIACDGLWDYLTEDAAAQEVYYMVAENPDDTERISKRLVQLSRYQGSTDNISVIVVFLREPRKIAAEAHRWATRNGPPLTTDNMEAGLDNANNPFTNSNGSLKNLDVETDNIHLQKGGDGLLLNLTDNFKPNGTDLSQDIFEKSNGTKNSSSEIHFDDGFGPETDVDAVDDAFSPGEKSKTFAECLSKAFNDEGLPKSFNDEVKAFTEGLANNNPLGDDFNPFLSKEVEDKSKEDGKEEDFEEHGGDNREETPTPPADAVHDVGGLEENPVESDSEDEWNYFKGDQAKAETSSSQPETVVETSELEDAMSQLNPNAAEFVPVSPTRSIPSPACRALINDEVISQSPKRPVPVDIKVPNETEFESEVKSRPSDFDSYSNGHDSDSEHNTSATDQMENILNGKSIDEIPEFQPGSTPTKQPPADEFHFGPNAAPFTPRPLDQSEALSTKANYGDDTEQTLNTSFNDSELAIPHKDLGDPMSMSFSAERGETNPFQDDEDLNRVHDLPENLDDFLAKNGAENKENTILDDTISDLPDHNVFEPRLDNDQAAIQTTDLDKISQDDEKELASPLEPEDDFLDLERNINAASKTPDSNILEGFVVVPEKLLTDDSNISSLPELEPIEALHSDELGLSPIPEPRPELSDLRTSPLPGEADLGQAVQSMSPIPHLLSDLQEEVRFCTGLTPEVPSVSCTSDPSFNLQQEVQSVSPILDHLSDLQQEVLSVSPIPDQSSDLQQEVQSVSPLPDHSSDLQQEQGVSPVPHHLSDLQQEVLSVSPIPDQSSDLQQEVQLVSPLPDHSSDLLQEQGVSPIPDHLSDLQQEVLSVSPIPDHSSDLQQEIQSVLPLLDHSSDLQHEQGVSPIPDHLSDLQQEILSVSPLPDHSSDLQQEDQAVPLLPDHSSDLQQEQGISLIPEHLSDLQQEVQSVSPLPDHSSDLQQEVQSVSSIPDQSSDLQEVQPVSQIHDYTSDLQEEVQAVSPVPDHSSDLQQEVQSSRLDQTSDLQEGVQSVSPIPDQPSGLKEEVQSVSPISNLQEAQIVSPILDHSTDLQQEVQLEPPIPDHSSDLGEGVLPIPDHLSHLQQELESVSPIPDHFSDLQQDVQGVSLISDHSSDLQQEVESVSSIPDHFSDLQQEVQGVSLISDHLSDLPEVQSVSPIPDHSSNSQEIQSLSPIPDHLPESKSPLPEESKSPVPAEHVQEIVQQAELADSRLSPLPGQLEVHPESPSPVPSNDLSESKSPIPEESELLQSKSPIPTEQEPENILQEPELSDSRLSLPGQLDLRQQEVQSVSPLSDPSVDLLESKSPLPDELLQSKSPIPTEPEPEKVQETVASPLLDLVDQQTEENQDLGGLEFQAPVCGFTLETKVPLDVELSELPVCELKPTSDMLETEFNPKSDIENIQLEAASLREEAAASPVFICEHSADRGLFDLQQLGGEAIRPESRSPFDPQQDQRQEEEVTSSVKDDISSPMELLSPVKSPEPLVEELYTEEQITKAESEPVLIADIVSAVSPQEQLPESLVQEQEVPKTEAPPQEFTSPDLLGDLICPMPSSEPQVEHETVVQKREIGMFEASAPLEPSQFTELSNGLLNFSSEFTEQFNIKTENIKPEFAEPAVITPSEDSKVIDELPAATLPEVPVQEPIQEIKLTEPIETSQEAPKELPVLAPLPIVPVTLQERKEVKKEEKKTGTAAPAKKPIGKVAPSKTSTAPKAPIAKTSPRPAASSPKAGVPPRVPSKTGPPKTTTAATKTTTSTTAATKPSPKPKTAPAPKPIEKKPLTNGDVKPAPRTTLTKRPSAEAPKTTTARPATATAAKTSPLKTTAARPSTAPRTAPLKTSTSTTAAKPAASTTTTAKPRVPLASRTTTTTTASSKLGATTTATRTTTTTTSTTRTSLSPKTATAPAPAKPKTITYNAPKPRVPLTKTVTKSADVEKEKKESANKLTASRSTTVTKTSSATATSRTATTTVKKTETKPLSNRTALTKTTTTKTTLCRKPGEVKSVTKTKTTKVEKPKENGVAPTSITEEIKEITIVNNVVNETEDLLKDNSPLDNKLITETTNALIDVNPAD